MAMVGLSLAGVLTTGSRRLEGWAGGRGQAWGGLETRPAAGAALGPGSRRG